MSTPEQYFGGAPNAFAGGMAYGAAQRRLRTQDNALNALIAQYGPAAANPSAVATMQDVTQNAAEMPYRLAQAQRVDAARRAEVASNGVLSGDPAVQQRDDENRLQAGRHAAVVLQSVKQNGGDIGQAFDFIQQALPAIGISPDHLATIRDQLVKDPSSVDEFVHLLSDPNGQKLLSGGQPFYDKTGKLVFGSMDTQGGMHFAHDAQGNLLTPANAQLAGERVQQGNVRIMQGAQKIAQGARKLTDDELKMRGGNAVPGYEAWQNPDGTIAMAPIAGTKQAQEFEGNLHKEDAVDQKAIHSFESLSQHSDVVTTSAQRALKYFSGADAGVLMQSLRSGTKLVPGTKAYEANQALNEIRNNLGIDELQRMRQNSPTGSAFGRTTNLDLTMLTGALGQLEVARDPQIMAANLNRIIESYNKLVAAAQQDAETAQQRAAQRRAQYGSDLKPPRAPGNRPAADASLNDLLDHYAPVPK